MYMYMYMYPSTKVMANFVRHKIQHDALIQFARFLVGIYKGGLSFNNQDILTFALTLYAPEV